MRFRFASFELDDSARRLLREEREVPVQRLIFDLLAYLLRHRERVVSKDELVTAVWAGAFVADSAVLRAVSVARRLLRSGGAAAAIRTYPRQGYRFSAAVKESGAPVPEDEPADPLAAARAAFELGAWAEAAEGFAAADRRADLAGEDLERWAEAQENRCRPSEALLPLKRAVAAFAAAADLRGAARAAIRLGNLQLEGQEATVGRGWQRRAARYLTEVGDCRESGLLAWLACRYALFDGDLDGALRHAERVCDLGRRLDELDLEALGLAYRGYVHLARGEMARGAELLDEAGAAVLTGERSAWVTGLVYCGIVWGCMSCGDLVRAGDWNRHFTRWCSTRGVAGYPGLCRLHRAEILTIRGELAAAEREASEACGLLAQSLPWAEGEAHRVLGEVLLNRGDLAGAESAFGRSYELGCEPQPGLALLRLGQGHAQAAVDGLERALAAPGVQQQRRGLLLAHLALVAAVGGFTERSEAALRELGAQPELSAPSLVAATMARASGELALGAGDAAGAATCFRRAIAVWTGVPSPANAAGLRLRLAQCLATAGDEEGAAFELTTAKAALARLGLAAPAGAGGDLSRQ